MSAPAEKRVLRAAVRTQTPLSARADISPAAQGQTKTKGEVRIIGGVFKRSVLRFNNIKSLRPTPNRVRETLFNWLGQDLTGLHCVDAFAGSGALGFEAASRNAASVLMFEQDATQTRMLIDEKDRIGIKNIKIHGGDALQLLAQLPPKSQDVVFLDPPYTCQFYMEALSHATKCLKPSGIIYMESNRSWSKEELLDGSLSILKSGKAGMIYYMLLQQA